jgi:hypothetical protein
MSSDMNIQGQNISTSWQSLQQTDAAQQLSGVRIADTIFLGPQIKIDFNYLQDPSNPLLPKPGENALFPRSFTGPAAKEPPPNPEQRYSQIASEKVAEFATKNNLTQAQVQKLVEALLTSTPPQDPALAGFYGQLEDAVMSQLLQEYTELPKDWKPKETKTDYKLATNQTFDEAFEENLQQMAQKEGLSKEEMQQIRAANNNRLPNGELNPDFLKGKLAEIAKQINSSALSAVQQEFGVSSTWRPEVDSTEYNAKAAANYDQMFLNELEDFAQNKNLSQDAVNQIKYAHYHPEAQVSDKKIANYLNEIEKSILSEFQKNWGFPSSYTPQPATNFFDRSINGNFQYEFYSRVQSQSPPLSKEQLEDLLSFLNGNAPKLSTTAPLYQSIYNAAVESVQKANGLPSDWKPAIEMKTLGELISKSQFAMNMLKDANEDMTLLQKYVSQMPNGPDKQSYIDAIKIVTEALSTLKALVFIMQQTDSKLGLIYSNLQKELTLSKINEQQRKMDEMQKKRKKMKSMGPLMKVTKYFSDFMTVATALAIVFVFAAPVTAPLAIMFATSYTALKIANNHTDGKIYDKMTHDIQNTVANLAKAVGIPNGSVDTIKKITNVLTIIGMTTLAIVGGFDFTYVFQETSVMKDLLVSMGLTSMKAEIVQGAISSTIQAAITIAATVLIAVIIGVVTSYTGIGPAMAVSAVAGVISTQAATISASAAGTVGNTLTTAAQAALNAMRIPEQIVQKIVEILKSAFQMLETMITKVLNAIAKTADVVQRIADFSQNMNEVQKLVKSGVDQRDAFTRIFGVGYKSTAEAVRGQLGPNISRIYPFLSKGATLGQMAPGLVVTGVQTGMDLYGKGIQINNSIVQARLALMEGNLEKFKKELEALIQFIKKVSKDFLDNATGMGQMVKTIGEVQDAMWRGRSSTLSNISQSA